MPKPRKPHRAAIAAPMLKQFDPMLPTLVRKPFSAQQWLFEPKWDGWRATCFLRDGEARFVSRKRNSLNERFPQLKQVEKQLKAITAVLDGEIVALDKDGMPRFDALRFGMLARQLSFTPSTCCISMVLISPLTYTDLTPEPARSLR